MAKAYWNNTDVSIVYKVWTIERNLVTANNVKTLANSGITARLLQDDPRVFDVQGQGYRYSGLDGRVEFETTCSEQESMLKLIYGNKLLLLAVNVVTPHSVMHSSV